MNKGLIIGIIVAIGIGISAVVVSSYNEPVENPGQINPESHPGPREFTVTLSEEMGFQESPP